MKKAVSIVMALLMAAALIPAAYAESCRHKYTAEFFPADCQNPERTVYTCESCGDTYTKYGWEYDSPDGFGLVFDTVRDDENSTLTLSVTMLNNPGLLVAQMSVGYNASVLSPKSFSNGNVWAAEDYPYSVNLNNNPVKIYTELFGTESNYKSGLYYTITFDILNPDGDYGLVYSINEKNFVDWECRFYKPQVIDLTGKRETGDHIFENVTTPATCTDDGYTEKVCRVCGERKIIETFKAAGHSYGESVVECESVGSQTHGYSVITCSGCGDRIITVLPYKGDANDDGKCNAVDANLMKQYLLGTLTVTSEQIRYAVDINNDGKINSVDMNLVKLIIIGAD